MRAVESAEKLSKLVTPEDFDKAWHKCSVDPISLYLYYYKMHLFTANERSGLYNPKISKNSVNMWHFALEVFDRFRGFESDPYKLYNRKRANG
mmetsp:Transcript_692/g.959  ORF Transcript_692/g.959 Transcript_692/m.959 type:complete len:93 (+) Transcript_692:975-1253(+)